MQQDTNRQSQSTRFPTLTDLPDFDQTTALTLHHVTSGDDAVDIQMSHLRFVYDETKQNRIQFAINPFARGKVLIFSPTSEMPVMNTLVIFNLAKKMKRYALHSNASDRFELQFAHIEFFEENFVRDAIRFRDAREGTLIVDSHKKLLKVQYHCKCNTPGGEDRQTNYFDCWDAGIQTIECCVTQCQERYHTTCIELDRTVDVSSPNWTCSKCSLVQLIQRGKFWGSRTISNTCTIDGHQTGYILSMNDLYVIDISLNQSIFVNP